MEGPLYRLLILPRSINKHDCDMQHSIIHNKKRHSPVVQTLGTIDEDRQCIFLSFSDSSSNPEMASLIGLRKCCCKSVNFNFHMIKVMIAPKIVYNLYFRLLLLLFLLLGHMAKKIPSELLV